jgi:hypothetical protein
MPNGFIGGIVGGVARDRWRRAGPLLAGQPFPRSDPPIPGRLSSARASLPLPHAQLLATLLARVAGPAARKVVPAASRATPDSPPPFPCHGRSPLARSSLSFPLL